MLVSFLSLSLWSRENLWFGILELVGESSFCAPIGDLKLKVKVETEVSLNLGYLSIRRGVYLVI